MKKQTLDEKQEEKSRLWIKYRAAKRAEWAELCEQEPRLAELRKTLRQLHTPGELLLWLADGWVRRAPAHVRFAALQQIDRHAQRMARLSGGLSLDDPLPPKMNVFLTARDMLAVR